MAYQIGLITTILTNAFLPSSLADRMFYFPQYFLTTLQIIDFIHWWFYRVFYDDRLSFTLAGINKLGADIKVSWISTDTIK